MSVQEIAEERFNAAMERTGARDPRPFYREQLKELKALDADAYQQGAAYYQSTLIPRVAEEDSDPIAEWLEYGRFLASLRARGETVQIDPSGRSAPYRKPAPLDHLVLHLPSSAREPGLPVGIPQELSPAQRASYDLLVKQKVAY